ncbi:MerR family transcriptional regulator [Paenibacillus campi]|uniref:MerR family transcriptional regulator n=1 Tax=Paenibacillus campi TaxID=3106031 RepID=UPI002B000322|nr:MerR family transcriptional regulator [Paenibacillus sp. SGZ-1009]
MKINELARKLGISARTIRFYEQHRLLPQVEREANQYRIFSDEDVWRLQTIIALREAGMSVKDIREVLEAESAQQTVTDRERLRYYLELQQALLAGQWLEMRRMAETTAQMLELLHNEREVPLQEFFELAQQARQLRELRHNWRDHWNFDQRATEHDQHVHIDHHAYPGYEYVLNYTAASVRAASGERGLDLGTGTGNLAGKLLAQGAEMSGIDQSREMLKQCRSKFPTLDVRIGNLLSIPYDDRSFDFVVSSFAFRYFTEQELPLALAELRRVLKPYGRICITDTMAADTPDKANDPSLVNLLQQWLEQHHYMLQYTAPYAGVFTLLAVPIRAQ